MRRKVFILAILGVCPAVFGQTPLGPATGVLEGSRAGVNADYSRADTDVVFRDGRKKTFDSQTAYATLSVALTHQWDFFVRVGGSQAETAGFDGQWDVSWGLGTRITAFQWRDFRWGFLGQVTNLVSRMENQHEFLVDDTPVVLPTTDELNLTEYVFATGLTWRHGPFTLYGGPLVRYVTGEFEIVTNRSDNFDRNDEGNDLRDRWDAGGYVGGQVTLFQTDPLRTYWFNRCTLQAEGRFTVDTLGFSVGVLLPFGGEY